jgi:hypothetical protein
MEEELWRSETLHLTSAYINALRGVHLDTGAAHRDLAWDNVIEIDRNYWRNVVVRIRIIRVTPAAGNPGQQKHKAKDDAAQRSVRKQKHSWISFQQSGEKTPLTQRDDTHILAES